MNPSARQIALTGLLGTGEPSVPAASAAQVERAAGVRGSIDVRRLRDTVEALAMPRSRLNAPDGMARAERLVGDALVRDGWSVERLPFTLTNERGVEDVALHKKPFVYGRLDGANLVAVREARAAEAAAPVREAFVVVAHLDTVRESPGADDNASGIAAILEMARLLPPLTDRTVVLAFVDYEEIGLVGSRVLVDRQLGRWEVRASIVLDCVGARGGEPGAQRTPPSLGVLYPAQAARVGEGSAAGLVGVLFQGRSRRLARTFAAWLRACAPACDAVMLRDPADLPVTGPLIRRVPAARNFGRSDHSRFWVAGLPSILLTDMAPFRNSHYHRPSDTPETLDYEFLADVTAATRLTVESLRLGEPVVASERAG